MSIFILDRGNHAFHLFIQAVGLLFKRFRFLIIRLIAAFHQSWSRRPGHCRISARASTATLTLSYTPAGIPIAATAGKGWDIHAEMAVQRGFTGWCEIVHVKKNVLNCEGDNTFLQPDENSDKYNIHETQIPPFLENQFTAFMSLNLMKKRKELKNYGKFSICFKSG
jgi:hypothetical protein